MKSISTLPPGVLYIVATPIGNLEDISHRALRILKEVDAVACEDSRVTSKLLRHFEIQKPLISYHDFNEKTCANHLMLRLKQGESIALVSDAGTPVVSDPGYRLICRAIEENIDVIPIPGPSAVMSALSACGLCPDRFCFEGFLPEKKTARRKKILHLKNESRTLIFFESAKRLNESLTDFFAILGDRKIAIARELTKKFETWTRGPLSKVMANLGILKGEITIVLEGAADTIESNRSMRELKEDVSRLIEKEGFSRKEAIRLVAESEGISKKDLYQQFHSDSKHDKFVNHDRFA